jgi:Tfp pilus assembly protein PilN
MILLGILDLALVAGAWLVWDYTRNPPDVTSLAASESRLRAEWDDLGERIEAAEGQLARSSGTAQLSELTFLSDVMGRKRFSWTLVLREIERVIPPSVYLVGLVPDIGEDGQVFLQMEARGRSVPDVSQFMASLEMTDAFRNVRLAEDEQGVDGGSEVRVILGADYVAAALSEVSVR